MKNYTISLYVPQREAAIKNCIKELFNNNGTKYQFKQDTLNLKSKSNVYTLNFVSHENSSNILTDVLVYDTMSDNDNWKANRLDNVNFKTILIINADISSPPPFTFGKTAYPITYGLNQKCSLTASSIDRSDGLKLTCSLQRSIISLNQKTIEPQEIKVHLTDQAANHYDVLATVCLMLILK